MVAQVSLIILQALLRLASNSQLLPKGQKLKGKKRRRKEKKRRKMGGQVREK
jgi:hypothetical protein